MQSLTRIFDEEAPALERSARAAGGCAALRGREVDAALEQRFDAFVAEYRDRAVSIAWRLLDGDGAAAEDAAQEAFARAHRALCRFRGDAKLSTWFYRILVNEVRRHQRWRAVRRRYDGGSCEPEAVPDPASDDGPRPDPALRGRIGAAIGGLPRGQREAFVLVHLEGLTIPEVASATGRAEGTIKSHLHRALARLRKELADVAPTAASAQE